MNNFQREREGVNKIQQNNTKYARFSLEKKCVLFYILQFFFLHPATSNYLE